MKKILFLIIVYFLAFQANDLYAQGIPANMFSMCYRENGIS